MHEISNAVRKLALVITLTLLSARIVQSATNDPVNFADPLVEESVRFGLGFSATNEITIGDMLKLQFLEVPVTPTDNSVTNLDGLQFATNLFSLRLAIVNETDLSVLHGLRRLFSFTAIPRSGFTDARLLLSLTNLTEVYVPSSAVTNVETLSALRLRALNTSYMPISNAAFVSTFTNLVILRMVGNSFRDVSPILTLCNKLTLLDLSSTPLTNVTLLHNMVNLRSLTLNDINVSDCAFAASLTNLHELFIGDNALHDLGPLHPLRGLLHLGVAGNQIADITVVTNFPDLDFLDVGRNFIDFTVGTTAHSIREALTNREVIVFSSPQAMAGSVTLRIHQSPGGIFTTFTSVPSNLPFTVQYSFDAHRWTDLVGDFFPIYSTNVLCMPNLPPHISASNRVFFRAGPAYLPVP